MNQPLEVLPPAPEMKLPAVLPKLKCGHDDAAGKQLTKLYNDAQTGMRRIIALGLFAWHIKENELKHGEWGPWLAVNAPKLCRADSATGKPKAGTQLTTYMTLVQGVLEKAGFPTIEKYHDAVSKFPVIGNLPGGGFLLAPEKKVPIEQKPIREKIFALVDGKTQNQLFLEFKQADEDADKPKRGRLKGSAGLTKEQRERAAQRAEQERLNQLEETILENTDWLLEIADATHLGAMESRLIKKFCDAADTASGFGKRVLVARANKEMEAAK